MSNPDPIVFIPGLLCDEALWRSQVDHFASSRLAIVVVASEDDSIAGMAARVLAHAPPQFVLCGLSMGGYVAMEIMRVAPGRVSRLVLVDTSARVDTEQQRQRRADLIALTARGRFKGVSPQLLPMWLAPGSVETPEIAGVVIDMAARLGGDVYLRQQTAIMNRIDSRPTLAAVACPTCVVVGRLDRVTPIDVAEEMAALINGSRLEIIEGAAHLPPIEQAGSFNAVLDSFVKFT